MRTMRTWRLVEFKSLNCRTSKNEQRCKGNLTNLRKIEKDPMA